MSTLRKIRQTVIDRDYFLASHAEEEMLDDDLDRNDVENAILKGRIEKQLTHDFRGTRYRIEGPCMDGRIIHVIAVLFVKTTRSTLRYRRGGLYY